MSSKGESVHTVAEFQYGIELSYRTGIDVYGFLFAVHSIKSIKTNISWLPSSVNIRAIIDDFITD